MPNDLVSHPHDVAPRPRLRLAWRRIWFIYEKEMRETLRDKRVLFGVFISPLLITPLLLVVIGYSANRKAAEEKAEVLTIAIVGAPAALQEAMARTPSISLLLVELPRRPTP